MDEPNDRRASRGMAVVRPIAFAVLRFRIVSYRVGSTIRLQQGSGAGRNGSRAVCTARNLSRLMNNYDARLAPLQISPRCPSPSLPFAIVRGRGAQAHRRSDAGAKDAARLCEYGVQLAQDGLECPVHAPSSTWARCLYHLPSRLRQFIRVLLRLVRKVRQAFGETIAARQ